MCTAIESPCTSTKVTMEKALPLGWLLILKKVLYNYTSATQYEMDIFSCTGTASKQNHLILCMPVQDLILAVAPVYIGLFHKSVWNSNNRNTSAKQLKQSSSVHASSSPPYLKWMLTLVTILKNTVLHRMHCNRRWHSACVQLKYFLMQRSLKNKNKKTRNK